MVTAARLFARPIALCILMLLLAPAPAMVWADPGPDATSEVAMEPRAAGHDTSPAGLISVAGFRPVEHAPRWFEAAATAPAPAKTGSWWSRRTTAQKSWFIVGMVVGAVGIYAIASNGSSDDGGGGGY